MNRWWEHAALPEGMQQDGDFSMIHRVWFALLLLSSLLLTSPLASPPARAEEPRMPPTSLLKAATFYASFDEAVLADFGGGDLSVRALLDRAGVTDSLGEAAVFPSLESAVDACQPPT